MKPPRTSFLEFGEPARRQGLSRHKRRPPLAGETSSSGSLHLFHGPLTGAALLGIKDTNRRQWTTPLSVSWQWSSLPCFRSWMHLSTRPPCHIVRAVPRTRSTMIEKIWEVLTTLSDESQNAAMAKCAEHGFDPNRGPVSLDESYLNLGWARSILKGAIEENKLRQLPISIQRVLLNALEAISKHQSGLISGVDEVVNLTASIENLTTAIWQYGLNNLSDQLLGYHTKLNQLKQLETQANESQRALEQGLKSKAALEQLVADATNKNLALDALSTAAGEATAKVTTSVAVVSEAEQKASALLATIQQSETTSTQKLASSDKSNAEILALEERVKLFFSEIEKYKTAISTTEQAAVAAVSANTQETENLIGRLRVLENQIKDQLQKATGFSLFHSFQTRQGELSKSRDFWSKALLLAVLISILVTMFIAGTTTTLDIGFFLKLSLSLPMIFAITFCALQYSRERKLEEEYAFKSNISISLEPYRTLVEKLIKDDQKDERQRYAEFVISSIQNVFTSPTEKIFKDKSPHLKFGDKDSIKQVTELIDAVAKIAK